MKTALAYKPDVIKVFTDGWRYGTAANLTSMNLETLSAIVADAHAAGLKVFTHTVTLEGAKIAARAGVDALAHGIGDEPADDELLELLKKTGTAYAPTLAVYETHRFPVPPRAVPVMEPDVKAAFGDREDAGGHSPGAGAPLAEPAGEREEAERRRRPGGAGHRRRDGRNLSRYATLRELELLVEAG